MKMRSMPKIPLWAGILCLSASPVFAAGDVVDLLAFDPVPAMKPLTDTPLAPESSTAPPVSVTPPVMQAQPKPLPPVDVKPKKIVKIKPVSAKPAVKPQEEKKAAPVVMTPKPIAEHNPPAAAQTIAAGETLTITVEGESDLSGVYRVMPDGMVILPLIGEVRAQGFAPAKLAEILTATLKDGYLVDPHISIQTEAASQP